MLSVCPDSLRAETAEARAAVDFFISSVSHLVLLGVVSTVSGLLLADARAYMLAVGAFILVPAAYRGAVESVGEYGATVRAIANVSRADLASKLGYTLPSSLTDEHILWQRLYYFLIEGHKEQGPYLDPLRSQQVSGKGGD
jgi:hypothetical protein